MKFPSKKNVKEMLKKIDGVEGTLVPGPEASALELFRCQLQQGIVSYKIKNKLSGVELANLLEVDEAKVSKIVHNRLEQFSTDRLISLYLKLYPNAKVQVA